MGKRKGLGRATLEGLSVAGDLVLAGRGAAPRGREGLIDARGCEALEVVGNGDREGGSPEEELLFEGCEELTSLPQGLKVRGNLLLSECRDLRSLPEGLSVGGSLRLRFCSGLVSLPCGVRVGGDLHVSFCTALCEVPEVLEAGGDVVFRYCTNLTTLPQGLAVHARSLTLSGSEWLTELPEGLAVDGMLDVSGCSALAALPCGLRVGGDLILRGCVALQALPEDMHVKGSLDLAGCEQLTELPPGLVVAGSLTLAHCSALEALPGGLRVAGRLDLSECRRLVSIPPDLRVEGGLCFSGCEALTSFPEGVPVASWLNMNGCRSLVRLPVGLSVPGNLELEDCVALQRLPRDLHVGGDLIVRGCSQLTKLPDNLYVGFDLDVEDCGALASVPATVLSWPLCDDGRAHELRLRGAGLSADVVDWLLAAQAPGLSIAAGARGAAASVFDSCEEGVAFWAAEAGRDVPPAAARLRGSDGSWAVVTEFLARLRDSREFAISETRAALAGRVLDVLEVLASDTVARSGILQRMSDSLVACGDSPAWALNQMCVVVAETRAMGDRDQLRALGKRVMRLMVVHEHAARKVRSLEWVDDVCVYLRFEIELREALDLPVGATSMIFPEFVEVTDEELQAAKEEALGISQAQFEEWLEEWPAWQRQLRKEAADTISWVRLPGAPQRRKSSLRRRLSHRLSKLLNVVGERMQDPVQLAGVDRTWSLEDLMRHWVPTGVDLDNRAVSIVEMATKLRRVNATSN